MFAQFVAEGFSTRNFIPGNGILYRADLHLVRGRILLNFLHRENWKGFFRCLHSCSPAIPWKAFYTREKNSLPERFPSCPGDGFCLILVTGQIGRGFFDVYTVVVKRSPGRHFIPGKRILYRRDFHLVRGRILLNFLHRVEYRDR